MSGMDHSAMAMDSTAMPGMQGATVDAGTEKLQRLMGELVRDPVVRQRILADSALRRGWQNPAVRQSVRTQP